MPRINSAVSIMLVAVSLAGCSFAPKYDVPQPPGPDAFKEAALYNHYWKPASNKAGQLDRGDWWTIFNDPALNALEDLATKDNPNLAAAAARIEQAQAVLSQARANLYPSLDVTAGVTRGSNVNFPQLRTNYSILATVDYGIDFFGRVRSASAAARFTKERADALYNQALLFLHADVAQNYYTLLALDTERDLLQQTIASRVESQKLVQRRFQEGEANEQESLRAQAELSSTRADLTSVEQQRAIVEHALAILLGQTPAQFSQAQKRLPDTLPMIPPGLPSSMLERRPDIAAAQAQLTANNARIGLARAAFFPMIGLTAQTGLASDELSGVFDLSNDIWSIGPLLSLPIFDGGRRRADLALSNAVFRESVATYRASVLVAFKEVEDNLVALRLQGQRANELYQAAQASKKAESISQIRYREGEGTFLEALDTQRDTLAAQRFYTQTQGQRFVTTINLIRALGGGWAMQEAAPQNGDAATAIKNSGENPMENPVSVPSETATETQNLAEKAVPKVAPPQPENVQAQRQGEAPASDPVVTPEPDAPQEITRPAAQISDDPEYGHVNLFD